MAMTMVERGHVVHAASMFDETYHLAWGDLGIDYPDPWTLGETPPPSASLAVDEPVVRRATTHDQLKNPAVINEGVKKVYQGATVFVEGVDYTVLEGGKIDWQLAGQEPAVDSVYQVVYRYAELDIQKLINEFGRRQATQVQYVIEDPNGDIVCNNTTWKIVTASQSEVTAVTCLMASTLSGGEYFELFSKDQEFYVWFTVDGVGIDPALPNKTGVVVALSSLDGTITVATKLATAVDALEKFEATQKLDTEEPFGPTDTVHISTVVEAQVKPTVDGNTGFGFAMVQRGTDFPTRNVYMQFKFDALDAMDKDVYQIGLFINTVRTAATPAAQHYLAPSEIEDPGLLYMIENIEPFPRTPGKREIFEYVVVF